MFQNEVLLFMVIFFFMRDVRINQLLSNVH